MTMIGRASVVPGPVASVAAVALGLMLVAPKLSAQELEPGAYSPSPVGVNMLIVGDTFSTGDLAFDPSGPFEDGNADIHAAAIGYARTLGVAGRAASLAVGLPYVRGDLSGLYLGDPVEAHRSGWGDPRLRAAINLYGTPAMTMREFAGYTPGTIVGASLTVAVPLGKYDPTKIVNIGGNRWAFKPEIGVTRRVDRWTFEGYAGVWLFTDNTNFREGNTRAQDPIGSFQVHVIYTIKPRMWLALDGNYFTGGRTSVNGADGSDLQKNARVGLTFALPVNRQHSLKFGFSRGARTTVGADFESYGVAWQYIWGGSR